MAKLRLSLSIWQSEHSDTQVSDLVYCRPSVLRSSRDCLAVADVRSLTTIEGHDFLPGRFHSIQSLYHLSHTDDDQLIIHLHSLPRLGGHTLLTIFPTSSSYTRSSEPATCQCPRN